MDQGGEDLLVLAPVFFVWSPYHCSGFVGSHVLELAAIGFGIHLEVVANVMRESGVARGHTIGVYLPTDLWVEVELLLEESLTHHEVIKDAIILSDCFIWSTPATTHQVQVAALDKLLGLILNIFTLEVVPLFEVLYLSIGERQVAVLDHFRDHGVKDVANSTDVDLVWVSAGEVVLWRGHPAFAIVSMWNQVHISLWPESGILCASIALRFGILSPILAILNANQSSFLSLVSTILCSISSLIGGGVSIPYEHVIFVLFQT